MFAGHVTVFPKLLTRRRLVICASSSKVALRYGAQLRGGVIFLVIGCICSLYHAYEFLAGYVSLAVTGCSEWDVGLLARLSARFGIERHRHFVASLMVVQHLRAGRGI